mmetsp:Transcript_14167/g.24127  ORF Transcript_14167/g.24127 Transcript_14167/m.24127 type:complete len:200 (+) Transcript_14167:90-689(+)
MQSKLSIALLVFILFNLAYAGPFYALCVGGCTGFCTLGAPPAFPACMAACAAGCATSCFTSNSTVTMLNPITNLPQVQSIIDCKSGDLVMSSEGSWTKVVKVEIMDDSVFDILKISLDSGDIVTVTPNHGMFILDNKFESFVIPAEYLKVGDKLPSNNSVKEIVSIERTTTDKIINIVTVDGTIYSNGISLSTLCNEEV